MKICTKCNQSKFEEEFSKRKGTKDGLKYECRSCNNIRCKLYLKNEENRISSNLRSMEFYNNNKEQQKINRKIWYEENREKAVKNARSWGKENINRKRENARNYKKKQKELEKAKLLVNADYKKKQKSCHEKVCYAIKTGKIIKPINCEKCNEKKDLQGHHEDYSKPLDVIWLCVRCHHLQHNRRVDIPS